MGIRNTALFNQSNEPAPATNRSQGNQQEREPAQFYLNIGVQTNDEKYPFIDLAKSGIALDRVPMHDVRGNLDTEYKQFQALQNDLAEKFIQRAEQLQPGETAIVAIDEDTGLCMQIRRVTNKEEMPVATASVNGLQFR